MVALHLKRLCDYAEWTKVISGQVNYPFPKRQILDSSKLIEFADDNFKLDENGRKFAKWVENNAGKGEIARYEQFLLFPQCFQKNCTAGENQGLFGKGSFESVNKYK